MIAAVGKHNSIWSGKGYNYLAIGNSITKHGISDYWWNEVGMAATRKKNDYVHIVKSELEKKYGGGVCVNAFNFFVWETQSFDRSETLEMLLPYLDEKIDLVSVQLSENVSDMTTFEMDFEELIRYIKRKAPRAVIIVIDDFWSKGEKSIQKQKAAENTGAVFVSLSEIKGDASYQCGLGTAVYDEQDNEHIVEHNGVAVHPGDKGMAYIAQEVLIALESFSK